jgi:SAM-dependent methyltransferase
MTESSQLPFKNFFNNYILSHKDQFSGKTIVDFPAGSGETSRVLRHIGAHVLPFDLFPEYFKVDGLECKRANIMDGIPLPDASADILICQEGIEHFSDQLFALREFNRVLKNGGLLVITTPNHSNLRSKVSYLLSESERFGSMMPPNEIDSVWMADADISDEIYCGHIFLLGIQKLRVLSRLAGFKIARINSVSIKPTSTLLFPFLYPMIFFINWLTYRKNLKKNNGISFELKKEVYGELYKLAINPRLLVDGTLFVEFSKEMDSEFVSRSLKYAQRRFEDPT